LINQVQQGITDSIGKKSCTIKTGECLRFFLMVEMLFINQALQGIVDFIGKERNAKKTPKGC